MEMQRSERHTTEIDITLARVLSLNLNFWKNVCRHRTCPILRLDRIDNAIFVYQKQGNRKRMENIIISSLNSYSYTVPGHVAHNFHFISDLFKSTQIE